VFPKDELIDRTSMIPGKTARIASGSMRSAKGGSFSQVCGPRVHRRPCSLRARSGIRGVRLSCCCGDVSQRRMSAPWIACAGRGATDDLAAVLARAAARLGAQRTYVETNRHCPRARGAYGLGVIYAKTMFGTPKGTSSMRCRRSLPEDLCVVARCGPAGRCDLRCVNVRSPAPPVIALVGLLGILIGEQLVRSPSVWFRASPSRLLGT